MAREKELLNVAVVAWLVFFSLIPPVEAYDAGDALALLLCSILTGVGFCACLGWYARRRNGQMWRRRGGGHEWGFTDTSRPVSMSCCQKSWCGPPTADLFLDPETCLHGEFYAGRTSSSWRRKIGPGSVESKNCAEILNQILLPFTHVKMGLL